jgi:hypothetical protein
MTTYTEDDCYIKAMRAAEDNMKEADRLAAAGDHAGAQWLSDTTMQAAIMLSTSEALYQGLHGRKKAEMKKTTITTSQPSMPKPGDIFTIAGVNKPDPRWWKRLTAWLLRRPPPMTKELQRWVVKETT